MANKDFRNVGRSCWEPHERITVSWGLGVQKVSSALFPDVEMCTWAVFKIKDLLGAALSNGLWKGLLIVQHALGFFGGL